MTTLPAGPTEMKSTRSTHRAEPGDVAPVERPPLYRSRKRTRSDYSRDTERTVERLLAELYEALDIHKPDDLFGSVVIDVRYQNGKPVGQVDVNIKYVMKRSADGEYGG